MGMSQSAGITGESPCMFKSRTSVSMFHLSRGRPTPRMAHELWLCDGRDNHCGHLVRLRGWIALGSRYTQMSSAWGRGPARNPISNPMTSPTAALTFPSDGSIPMLPNPWVTTLYLSSPDRQVTEILCSSNVSFSYFGFPRGDLVHLVVLFNIDCPLKPGHIHTIPSRRPPVSDKKPWRLTQAFFFFCDPMCNLH